MSVGRVGQVAAATGAAVGVGLGLESLARRVEGALRPPLPAASEAAFKLQRLRGLRQRRQEPEVVFIGASVLDADIDPKVVDEELRSSQRSFNACLTGSDLDTMRRWWRMLRAEIRPEVVVVEAHPGMMLPPGTMADKLHVHLAHLEALLEQERPPVRPALRAVATAGWPRLSQATRDSLPLGWADDASADGPGDRNRANGHLTVFQDIDFDTGALQLGPGNWYDLVQIDLSADWRHREYFDFVDEVRSSVAAVMVAVSPLLLEGAPATAAGAHIPSAISDATVERAAERDLAVVDLRNWVGGRDDFADPFHLRGHAVERVSRAAGSAVRQLAIPR